MPGRRWKPAVETRAGARCSWPRGGAPQLLDGPPSDRDGSFPTGGDDGQPGQEGRGAARLRRRCAAEDSAGRPPPEGGSASPRPITAGDNAVYRLDADGVPREVLRFKALVHALAWANDRLIVGTGPEGVLFEVREAGHETAPIAKLDSGQILSLLTEPDGTRAAGNRRSGHGRPAFAWLRRRRDRWSRRSTTRSS